MLVFATWTKPPTRGGVRTSAEISPLSAGKITEIASRQRSFSGLAAFDMGARDSVLATDDGPRPTISAYVDPHFFDILGVVPAIGRSFRDDEAVNGLAPLSAGQLTPDTAPVVMVADTAWRELFGADPAVIGRAVRIDGVTRTVIGVLPRGFFAPMPDADFYFAMDIGPVAAHPIAGRGSGWLGLVARLQPQVTVEQARAEVAGIWADFARRYPDEDPLAIGTVPLRDAIVGETRRPLLVLMRARGWSC